MIKKLRKQTIAQLRAVENVKSLLEKSGAYKPVEDLAYRLGVSKSTIYSWLKGSASPHSGTCKRIDKLAKEVTNE